MFVFLLTTLHTHFILYNLVCQFDLKSQNVELNIDSKAPPQKKTNKHLKTTKNTAQKTCFYIFCTV